MNENENDTTETRLVSAKEDARRVVAIARAAASFALTAPTTSDWHVIATLAEEIARTARWRIEHQSEDRVTFVRTGPR